MLFPTTTQAAIRVRNLACRKALRWVSTGRDLSSSMVQSNVKRQGFSTLTNVTSLSACRDVVCIQPQEAMGPRCNSFGTSQQQKSQDALAPVFATEGDYHKVADETLEDLQDAIEQALEDSGTGVVVEDSEVILANGVLTLVLPPHGTWVINKQTPNQQIWWSSPLSGPRRYEYDVDSREWVYTRQGEGENTLAACLKDEIYQIYKIQVDF